MQTHICTIARLSTVAVLAVGLGGCVAVSRPAEPVVVTAEPTAEKPAKPAEDAANKAEKEAEEAAADARKHAKLQRDLAIAHEKLAKARMGQAHCDAQHAAALAKTERELALEQQRRHIFTERSVPNRIGRAKLELVRTEDRAKEADEELKQLEMLYAEEEFADQTKEIVLERGRRRLARSQRDLELRRDELAVLTEKTIPLEVAEHEAKVEDKARALDKAGRDAEAARLGKHIAVMSAEAEIARLEAESKAIDEKIAKRQKQSETKTSEKE